MSSSLTLHLCCRDLIVFFGGCRKVRKCHTSKCCWLEEISHFLHLLNTKRISVHFPPPKNIQSTFRSTDHEIKQLLYFSSKRSKTLLLDYHYTLALESLTFAGICVHIQFLHNTIKSLKGLYTVK